MKNYDHNQFLANSLVNYITNVFKKVSYVFNVYTDESGYSDSDSDPHKHQIYFSFGVTNKLDCDTIDEVISTIGETFDDIFQNTNFTYNVLYISTDIKYSRVDMLFDIFEVEE